VRARTVNQKRLVTASEKNDIVFAIGPAGTGRDLYRCSDGGEGFENKSWSKIIDTPLQLRQVKTWAFCLVT
jgi:phosphate starvation-inducible PhoH-like protein